MLLCVLWYLQAVRSAVELFYYDGLARQDAEIHLTVTHSAASTAAVKPKDDFTPPIDLVIRTLWGAGVQVDWNGTEPWL